MKFKKYLIAPLFALTALNVHAYVECEGYVKEILPHVTSGVVWIELMDGTKVRGNPDDKGLDRNVSMALVAMMANKKVRILLNDGQSCFVNSHENWSYIVSFNQ